MNDYEDALVDAIELCERRALVRELYECLSAREREIIARRFGLDGEPPESRTKIGRDLSLTRERVRALEIHALRRMMLGVDARTAPTPHERSDARAAYVWQTNRADQRRRERKVALLYRMLDSGMSVEDTARMTGLTEVVVRHMAVGQRPPLH